MAGDARDLELRLITRDEVDTSAAVREVDNLAEAADTTSRRLDDEADAAQRADRAVADLGGSSSSAAGDVDRLGSSADDAGRQLGDGLEEGSQRAGESVETMKDEAGAALLELAGSFDGTMTGLLDTVQGAVPAIGAAFGPIGLAAGAAVGIGLGFARAGVEKLREEAAALTTELIAGGGRLTRDSLLGRLETLASDGTLAKLADQAREAKVPVGDFLAASAGDPAAIERTNAALEARRDALYDNADAANAAATYDTVGAGAREEQRQAIERATGAINADAEARDLAASAVEAYDAAVASTADTAERAAEVQATFGEALTGAGEDAAAMADAITEGVDAVIAAQERQLQAAANFQENSQRVFEAVGQAGVDWALAQGENADEAMQLLADAPAAKQQTIVANYTAIGRTSGYAVAAGIRATSPAAQEALGGLFTDLQRVADGRPIRVSVITDPSGLNRLETVVRTGKVRQ